MLVTTLCWQLYHGDSFMVLVIEYMVVIFFVMLVTISVQRIRLQHFIVVTNIIVAESLILQKMARTPSPGALTRIDTFAYSI